MKEETNIRQELITSEKKRKEHIVRPLLPFNGGERLEIQGILFEVEKVEPKRLTLKVKI